MPRGENTVRIHCSIELKQLIEKIKHMKGWEKLHNDFVVARIVLIFGKEIFINDLGFGKEKYEKELARYNRTQNELRDENLKKKEKELREKEERLKFEREKLEVEKLKTEAYAKQVEHYTDELSEEEPEEKSIIDFSPVFCPECGTELRKVENDLLCHQCKKYIRDFSKFRFCPKCGHQHDGIIDLCANCNFQVNNNESE